MGRKSKAARKKAARKAAADEKAKEEGMVEASSTDQKSSFKDKGVAAYKEHRYPEAISFFTQAIEAKEGDVISLYSNRSAAYASNKDYGKALDDSEKVIEGKPAWAKGYYRKGFALQNLLRYPEAYTAYNKGLTIDPTDAFMKKDFEALSVLLDELRITKEELGQESPDSDRFDDMVQWLRDGGAKFPKLYLQYYSEDYRGVHCLAKIPPEDVILYVPFKHIMTSEVAKESDIGNSILSSGVELRSKHSFLASYLLQEKHKKSSFWDPYLNILPAFYANMPIFFDEELLSWLAGSFSLEKIADRIDSLRREYDHIRARVTEFAKFQHEEFVWARLVVITRIFGLVINGNKTDGLVPYADMLNHRRPRETKWTFDDNRYGFIITSLRTIQRGEQVYDSYGRKCNSRFFVNYGFALDDNEDNEAVMRLELPQSDPHYSMKIGILGGRPINGRREYQVPGNYREKKAKELFSFMRFVHAKDKELMLLSSSDGFKLDEIEPISIRNELACVRHLAVVCQKVLNKFPETLEHDLELLASDKLEMYSNKRNCVVMRRGEKQVLRWFVDLADIATKYLKLPWKDLKKVAAKCYQGSGKFDAYVTSVIVPLVKRAS